MWVMLTTGALSIVQRDPKWMSEKDYKDGRTMQVRARRREWLDEFRSRYCPELTKSVHVKNADYQWRGYATPAQVAVAVGTAALAVDYRNFKSATMTKKYGLGDAKLRSGLHDAYSKCWSELLAAGDGTSGYQGSWLSGIDACRCWGHWWAAGKKTCSDCSAPNPAYPRKGPTGVYPEGYPKGKKQQESAKGDTHLPAADPYKDDTADRCPGSWGQFDALTFQADPVTGDETVQCDYCGRRVPPTHDGQFTDLHWDEELVS